SSRCNRLANFTIPGSVKIINSYAFDSCTNLISVTIGSGVTKIAAYAFQDCANLEDVYFEGNAPDSGYFVFPGTYATVHYLPETTGWNTTFGSRPTTLWRPQVQVRAARFDMETNRVE